MESALGRIMALHGGRATVVVESPLACRRCAAGKGCGAGLLQGNERSREVDIAIPPGLTLGIGEEVRLTVAPIHLLRAATLAYGLPLASMIIALAVAWMAVERLSDGHGIMIAVAGLVAGLLLSRRLLQREATCGQFVPVIDARPGVGSE